MADIYDEMRQKFGLTGDSAQTSSPTKSDPYDEMRMGFGLIPDTRPKKPAKPVDKMTQELVHNQLNLPNKLSSLPPVKPEDRSVQSITKGIQDLFNKGGQTPISKVVDRASAAGAAFLTPDAPFLRNGQSVPGQTPRDIANQLVQQKDLGNNNLNKVADFLGQGASFFVNPASLENGLIQGGYNAAENLGFTKVGQKLTNLTPSKLTNQIINQGARGATAGGIYGAGQSAIQGDTNPMDIAKSAGQNALLFGAGDAALPLLGAGLKKFAGTKIGQGLTNFITRNKAVAPELNQQTHELLALPEGRGTQRLNAALERSNLPANDSPIAGQGNIYKPQPLALPKGNYVPPTRLKMGTAEQTLNRVMTNIKPAVIERMTPPFENPNELAKWVKGHLGSDVSLNEVRNLSYVDLHELASEIRNNLSVHDTAVQVAREKGFNLPKLLDGVAPSIAEKAAQNAQQRAYGVYPDSVPLKQPQLNSQVLNQAAGPMQKVGFANREPIAQVPKTEHPININSEPLNNATNEKLTNVFQATHTIHPNAYGAGTHVKANVKGNRVDYASEDGKINGSAPVGSSHLVPIESKPLTEEPLNNDAAPEEYVVPRIRDKANSYADELIKSAKADLGSNRLSSNPMDIYAKLGAGYMLKGAVKLADFTEAMIRDLGEGIRPHIRDIFQKAKELHKQLKFQVESEELGLKGIDATKLKDVSNLNLNTSDVNRNFKNVFKNNFPQVKKAILDPFDEAKGQYVQEQKDLLQELRTNVVKKYGIQKGSKLSALVQKFGEKQITLDELKKQAPNKWEDVVKADEWFRKTYDELINKVNRTVQEIYPTRPDKVVPKRENYYRHFRELNGLSGLKNLFDTPSQIDPKLSGISPFTEPKTKWASFKQKRGLGEFKNDAVGGFLEYIPAASYAIHIDPQINVFRSLAKNLAEHTTDSRNINNFIKFLNNFANDLSGKTSPFDRWVEEIGGRKTLSVLSWANNRVKSNVILGNARSSLSQLANIPQGIAFAKQYSVPGATRTMMSIFEPNKAMGESKFMKERYIGKDFRKFDTDWLSFRNPLHTKRFAEWMMEFSDRVGTSFVWNSAYAKAVGQKIENPVKFADEETRRLVAGRGIGEVPLLQKSKVFQLIAPFQLEVANLWKIQKDMVSKKDFIGIVALYASSYLLNKVYEQVTGNGVVFDPIDAVTTALTEPDLSPLERFGRVGGEVLSNVPLGQNLAAMYPEYGTTLYGVKLPTRKNLFGDKDPTRFGEGLVLTKGLQDPLFKMLPGFGGNQLKKTIQGVDAIVRGAKYTEDFTTTGKTIESPKLEYKVNGGGDAARSILFGPSATKSAQEYFNSNSRPLSEKQTQQYSKSDNPDAFYKNLMKTRKMDSIKQKITDIKKDKKLTTEQKHNEITKQISLLQQLQRQSK